MKLDVPSRKKVQAFENIREPIPCRTTYAKQSSYQRKSGEECITKVREQSLPIGICRSASLPTVFGDRNLAAF